MSFFLLVSNDGAVSGLLPDALFGICTEDQWVDFVAWMTALIRHWSLLVDDISKETPKAWAEAQLRVRVEQEKERRLEELHQSYIKEEGKLKQMEKRKQELRKEEQEVHQRLHGLLVLEGKAEDVVGQYRPPLVGSLSETVMHSALFYHPKPSMVKQY
ncbi:hypothetical protein ANCCEY_12214 [Ancylostoma ceylanicum]|uniref:Uncharacterized protein n=1 Tax=Ancylostoma ceylanicum TaxID=53326 RepID=A0A0D6L9R2_9BILA|nr:hypothetical protein ANCCEY_12214 [Ancylostoma ceylanicum]